MTMNGENCTPVIFLARTVFLSTQEVELLSDIVSRHENRGRKVGDLPRSRMKLKKPNTPIFHYQNLLMESGSPAS